ncbi:MAG: CotH kinase family protein [Paenibacillaceae bacterium]|nr:CotH kinase family protein [Paenibacillaceae bacterium]
MELPAVHIVIRSAQWAELERNVWSDKFVDAALLAWGKPEAIRLRYRGGHTRDYPKRSYEVVRAGRSVHYNAEYDDPSMIRNSLSFLFFRYMGVPAPRTRHVQLFINGNHRGVYLEIEAVDRHFFRSRGLSCQSIVYAVNENADFSLSNSRSGKRKSSLFAGYEHKLGTEADRARLIRFIAAINRLPPSGRLPYIRANLDIENYLRWLAGAVFTGNYDGFDQNYALYRSRIARVYRIVPWDYEGTWGRNCFGKPCGSGLVRITGYNRLTELLLAIKPVRKRYKQILQMGLSGPFTPARLHPAIDRLHGSITAAISRDTERQWPLSVFKDEPRFIRNYIAERRRLISRAIAGM